MAVLRATSRSELGTRKVRRLREQGLVPGVVYGHGKEVVAVTVSEHDLDLAIHHGQRLLELEVGGRKENVLIKEVQYDPLGQEILHVDLTRVNLDERVEVTVPIVLRGRPVGVDEGGALHQIASEVTVQCMVRAIPEEIRASVNELNIGDTLYMRDLDLPEGAEFVSDNEMPVCSLTVVAEEEEVAEEAEEAAAQPEVIGEKKEEEQQGEEQAPAE